MDEKIMYIGERKVYQTTNAKAIGIPTEILKEVKQDLKKVKIRYDFEKKCMEVFFN